MDGWIHAHVRQEAFKVAEMTARDSGSSSEDSSVEVESPAELSIPHLSFTSNPPPPTANPSQLSQVGRSVPKTDEDKQPLLSSPEKSLDYILKPLSSDDWQKQIDGLTCI